MNIYKIEEETDPGKVVFTPYIVANSIEEATQICRILFEDCEISSIQLIAEVANEVILKE